MKLGLASLVIANHTILSSYSTDGTDGQDTRLQLGAGSAKIDWDHMEKNWQYGFQQMGIKPVNFMMLLTDSPTNSIANREKTVEILLETFASPAVFIEQGLLLNLYAHGRTTGCVVDCGFDRCSI